MVQVVFQIDHYQHLYMREGVAWSGDTSISYFCLQEL
jgi:hypothetical protein